MKKRWILMSLVLVLALLFTACTKTDPKTPGADEPKIPDAVDPMPNNDPDKDSDKDDDKLTSKHYEPTYSTYDTFDKMYADADVVVRGTVDKADADETDDYIYVNYKVKAGDAYQGDVKADDVLEIRQTRSSLTSKLDKKVGENSPVLSEGGDYFLFLKKVPAGDGYGEHYIIVGENQGYAEVDNTKLRTSSNLLKDAYASADDLITKIKGKLTTSLR